MSLNDAQQISRTMQHSILKLCNQYVKYDSTIQVLGVISITVDSCPQEITIKVNNTLKKLLPNEQVSKKLVNSKNKKSSMKPSFDAESSTFNLQETIQENDSAKKVEPQQIENQSVYKKTRKQTKPLKNLNKDIEDDDNDNVVEDNNATIDNRKRSSNSFEEDETIKKSRTIDEDEDSNNRSFNLLKHLITRPLNSDDKNTTNYNNQITIDSDNMNDANTDQLDENTLDKENKNNDDEDEDGDVTETEQGVEGSKDDDEVTEENENEKLGGDANHAINENNTFNQFDANSNVLVIAPENGNGDDDEEDVIEDDDDDDEDDEVVEVKKENRNNVLDDARYSTIRPLLSAPPLQSNFVPNQIFTILPSNHPTQPLPRLQSNAFFSFSKPNSNCFSLQLTQMAKNLLPKSCATLNTSTTILPSTSGKTQTSLKLLKNENDFIVDSFSNKDFSYISTPSKDKEFSKKTPRRRCDMVLSTEEMVEYVGTFDQSVTKPEMERLYVCEVCNEPCSGLHNFFKHTLSVHNTFICHQCNRFFSTKSSLLRHRPIHTGLRRYACGICNKEFYRKDKCRAHIKKHIDTKSPATTASTVPTLPTIYPSTIQPHIITLPPNTSFVLANNH